MADRIADFPSDELLRPGKYSLWYSVGHHLLFYAERYGQLKRVNTN